MKNVIINIPRRYVKEEWGGTETVVLETSNELKRKGFEVKIFSSLALSDKKNEEVFGIKVNRFNYTYTRLGLNRINKLLLDKRGGDLYSFSLFFRILFTKNVKVIHLHTTGRLGTLGRIAAKLKNIPCVASIHGGIMDIPKEQMNELTSPAKGTINWGKPLDILLDIKNVLGKVDGIICVGEKERDLLQEKYPGKEVVFIPNGVDEKKFMNGSKDDFLKKFGLAENTRIILCVASYNSQKNQPVLIEAFSKFKSKYPESVLVLIGALHDRKYFDSITGLTEKLNIKSSVIMLSNVRFDDPVLCNAYTAADVFVLPSKYEPFGIVILEAWVAHKPVVCSPVGGIPSFVKDGFNGSYFDLNSSDDLYEKIERYFIDASYRDMIVNNANKSVKEYTWGSITEKLLGLYDRLTEKI